MAEEPETICDGCATVYPFGSPDVLGCEHCGGTFCLDCYGQYHGEYCEDKPDRAAASGSGEEK
jgi:hypothetical protein